MLKSAIKNVRFENFPFVDKDGSTKSLKTISSGFQKLKRKIAEG